VPDAPALAWVTWHTTLPALSLALSLAAMAQGTPSPSGPSDQATARAPNPRSAAAEASEVQEDPFNWNISWKNWHGLNLYASGKTGLKRGNRPLLDFSETRLAASIGGRIEVDGAAYGTNGSLSGFHDGFDLRRACITVKGTSLLAVPFS
jgi:hypothetical protein